MKRCPRTVLVAVVGQGQMVASNIQYEYAGADGRKAGVYFVCVIVCGLEELGSDPVEH